MPSERIQRQIDRLLDEADDAARQLDWATVRARAAAALGFDADNGDALEYLQAAERSLAASGGEPGLAASAEPAAVAAAAPQAPMPSAFANGRYQVKKLLGEGGKKKVFLAHDTLLDRDVAFALIKTEGLDQVARERISREAQAMGRLGAHPHIVTVFDLGEEPSTGSGEGSQPYMVTELMAGGDVEGIIAEAPDGKLALDRALKIAERVCLGLAFAHEKGIVHRDLKPGNVWLTADGTAKIGDFGLAVAIDKTRLTQAGMMVGTVSYMPPEQAMGGEVTPRSDLYSLGCMLYEMLTGRPPFVGDDAVAIIGQHLNTPPVAPSWHRPDCPPGLEALVLRLLEKDPAKRLRSADEARQALVAITQGQQLRGESEASGSPLAVGPADPLYQPVFVGREPEVRQLHAAYDAVLAGKGGLVMVVGEPGIGKTSVCEQLATYVTIRGGRPLVGHCYEEGSLSLPYLPFVEAMRSYVLARDPEGLKQDLGSGAADVARIVSEIRDRIPLAPSPSPSPARGEGGVRGSDDPEEERWRLLQSVTGFLRNASQVQPLLVILEDLHDADRGTLDLLIHLARNLDGSRLLIAGTYRDVEVDRAHPLSGALAELRRSGTFLRVPLRGLTIDEVHRMMNIIRGQEVPWSRAEAIHRQTEGNPLFVQEVLRYLVEEGLVVREGGRYVRTDDGSAETGIPEGLRDVIGKRLSRLDEKTNQVLSIASVVGREFRLDVLLRLAGLPEEEILQALEEATERAVIEARSAVGANVTYRFAHAFFRQTLYEEISPARRIRWHQQVARALEAVHGRRLDEHATELAEHFSHSSDRRDLNKAVTYGQAAARRALSVYAYGEAARHLERALEVQDVLAPDDHVKRCDLLLALGEALMPAGEPLRAANQVAFEAFTLAEAGDDRARAARAACLGLEGLHRALAAGAPRTPEWAQWAERADHYAAPESPQRVLADIGLARAQITIERRSEGILLLRRALDLARRLDNPEMFFTAGWQAIRNQTTLANWRDMVALSEELFARPRAGVSPRTLGQALEFCGVGLLSKGDRDGAEQAWAQLDELAQRSRDPFNRLNSLSYQGLLATLDGRLEEAVAVGERIRRLGEEQGTPELGFGFAFSRAGGRALLYLGRFEEFGNWLQHTGIRQADQALHLPFVGGQEQAADLLAARWKQWGIDEGKGSQINLETLANLMQLALDTGDRSRARALASILSGGPGITVAQLPCCLPRLVGWASALLDEPDEARGHYQQAIDVCTRIRFRPELALTRLQLAELLLDHYPDERAEAIAHLDFAVAEFQDMKMQPSLKRALGHRQLLKA